jgi:Uri superfamily endonuclease
MTLPDLPAVPGAYVLLLTAYAPVVLNMPRFGKLTLAAGQYAYVGSAHGPGGLKARVGRHLRAEKPLHWHIDYLTAALPARHVVAVVVTNGARLECTWVKRLLALNGASAPAPDFGSSDCRNGCPAHLVRLPDGLKPAELEEVLVVGTGSDDPQRTPVETIQALLDAIDAGDDEAAERVAQTCAGQTVLLPALRPLLADADPDRRWWAVRTLAVIGDAVCRGAGSGSASSDSRHPGADDTSARRQRLGARHGGGCPGNDRRTGPARAGKDAHRWSGWGSRAGGRRPAEDHRRRPRRSSNQ